MKYKTLFRLLIKAIGVYFLAIGAAHFANSVFTLLYALTRSSGYPAIFAIGAVSEAIVEVALGLYLFLGGKGIVDRAIPGNRPYCHECGYDLTGAPRARCPECDTPFRFEDVQPAGERDRPDPAD